MSDTELTEEQLKEQKLEEARKKYEALKKKTKKKNKKSKKKDTDDADVKEDTPEIEGGTEDKDESPAPEAETTPVADQEPVTDTTTEANEEEVNETPTAPLESATQEEVEEKPVSNSQEEPSTAVEEAKEEASEDTSKSLPAELTKDVEGLNVTEESKPAEEGASADSLFPDSGPSFMETIQQSKQEDEIKKLKQENLHLKMTNDDLLEKIAQLTKENKELKFLKMDHQDQIETLNAQVGDLQSKLAKAQVDAPSHHHQSLQTAYDLDDNLSLSPSPSFAPQPFATNFSQFNLGRSESTQSLGEVKARLNKWKGWNVDMSTWRTVGSGPVVEI